MPEGDKGYLLLFTSKLPFQKRKERFKEDFGDGEETRSCRISCFVTRFFSYFHKMKVFTKPKNVNVQE